MRKKAIIVALLCACAAAVVGAFAACVPTDKETDRRNQAGYQSYIVAYTQAAGNVDGALKKQQWLDLLPEGNDKQIKSVRFVCGDAVIVFSDDSTFTAENVHADIGHNLGEGHITEPPTCSKQGEYAYNCKDCTYIRKETIELNPDAHLYDAYGSDENGHWAKCSICGNSQAPSKHKLGNWEVLEEVTYKNTPTVVGKIDGRLCECGYAKLRATAFGDYKFKEWSNGLAETTVTCLNSDECENTKPIFEVKGLNVPIIAIDTENCAMPADKENYVNCEVSLSNAEEKFCLTDVAAGVRLRGNSTMTYPKKPYRIKFDKKQGLFGWEKNKSWVLLALYQDFSNIKDYAAFTIANSISDGNSSFVPHAKHIELYINGVYQGLYLLCDQVQENSGRVGVEEDFTAEDTAVPFLVEMDEYAQYEGVENVDWFKITNADDNNFTTFYNIKYPEADQRHTQQQFEYIKNYINTVNGLCHNRRTTRAQFEEYIDLNSFIDYYLVQEIMGQGDINKKSVYMSKSKTGKLVMGPIWDFDWAAGGPMSGGGQQAANGGLFSGANWFKHMLGVQWFKTAVTQRMEEIDPIINAKLDELAAYKATIKAVSERNATMWDFDKDNSLPNFNEYYDIVIKYIRDRVWLVPLMISYIEAV